MFRLISGLLTLGALYLLLLVAPYPLFGYQASYQNITVFSDRPIPPAIEPLLDQVEERLRQSPLNDPALRHKLFLCSNRKLFALFANNRYRVGGVNYAFLNRNIFLRPAHIEANRLVGASGREVPGERTLVYFMAHEITHSLEARYLGRVGYLNMPEWKREGYADIVGKAGDFNFDEQLADFRRGAIEMDPVRSGLYRRYHLLCAYLLDHQHATAQELLTKPFNQPALEAQLSK